MIERYLEFLGLDNTIKLLKANEKPLIPSIRVNTLKISQSVLKIKLEQKGFKLEPLEWVPYGFKVIKKSFNLGSSHEFLQGYYYLQNIASMLPALILDPKPSDLVIDMCAAPGSKATQLAQIMKNKGTLILIDRNKRRIPALEMNLRRLGISNSIILNFDAIALHKLNVKADKILLDAPCTGEGLIRQDRSRKTSKKLKDISDLRDESSKGKIRIVIELKRGANSKFVINSLHKYTRLQDSFSVNFLALVNGQPKTLNLKQAIEEYVKHRKIIIINRTKYELKKAKERKEIVEGLLIALKKIDEIISLIKKSKSVSEVSEILMKKFSLSKRQTQAILETKLQQLTSLEQKKLKNEYLDLENKISEFEKILENIKEVLKIITKEISEIKKKYGDERKTRVVKKIGEISEKDLIQKKEVVVTITEKGYTKRLDVKSYS